ncbi:MAG: hypothetical protein IJ801_06135, partial [Lachnospiraceae bacterium]|nr:hypothetical protein [Lachnospiraceae bacterium]
DMKRKEGLSEEAAINDFGDLKELTDGILEAYHVNRDYGSEGKPDFDDRKEESRAAAKVIGKGAGAIGRGIGSAGKWGAKGMKKLGGWMMQPFVHLREVLHASKQKAEGRGSFGRIWLMFLGLCSWLWNGAKQCGMLVRNVVIWCTHILWKTGKWCLYLLWNLFWLIVGVGTGAGTLGCIFWFGTLVVFQVIGYPVMGLILITIGTGLICGAGLLLSLSLLRRKQSNEDVTKKDMDEGNFDEDAGQEEWDAPEENDKIQAKQVIVSARQEVWKHA